MTMHSTSASESEVAPDAPSSEATLDVSILVVSYNTRELTTACLRSVLEETVTSSFEVIVVDNDSSDGSADAIAREFPQVELLRLDENIGFARANNLASQTARGSRILLLNPDTVVLDRAIDTLVDFAKASPERGIVGGRTLFPDGSLNPTSVWGRPTLWSAFLHATCLSTAFPRTTFFSPRQMGSWKRDGVRQVDVVSGCFLLIKRNLWIELDGFDEEYFMYGEDVDLCIRASASRYRPLFTPEATIIHHGGASEPVRDEKMIRLLRAQVRTMRKHWSRPGAWIGTQLLAAGAGARLIAASVLRLTSRKERGVRGEAWGAVWRRRAEWTR